MLTKTFTYMNITTLNVKPIERVSSYKYLGFWLNDKLCFKKHIDEMKSKTGIFK